jgi:hypothetical protein
MKLNKKKISSPRNFLFLFIILLFISIDTFSQSLTFCESVDSNGNPKGSSGKFTIHTGGGFLEGLVTLPREVNSTFATYDIFKLDEENKELFESTIRQTLKPEFTWFSQRITFKKSGTYHVYVYDDRDRLLCVGIIAIRIQ